MGIPSASYSITMRVHLGADPLGIGRITTAVGEAAGTVVAVDIVESHPDLLVVDLTCNAVDARHADAITHAYQSDMAVYEAYLLEAARAVGDEIGRASCRERVSLNV